MANDDILLIEDENLDDIKKNINNGNVEEENIEDFDITEFIVDESEINDDAEEDEDEEIKEEKRRKKEARDLFDKIKSERGVPEPVIITKSGKVKKVSELTKKEQIDEFVRCAMDPVYLIETYFFIFDQTKGNGGEIVNFKLFDFQKRLIKDYQEHRFNVSNKYRQAGISTTTCAFIAWYIMFTRNRTVAIVANKQATATNELMSDVVDFIEGCPDFLKPQPLKNTQILKIYDNGSKVGAFNPKGLRGLTPTLLFWDEVAWTEKSDKFWEGAKPTLQTGGRAIFVSTPNSQDIIFYKTFDGAKNKKGINDFNAVELWWFNDPRYNIGLKWIKNRGKDNEIVLIDEGFSDEKRIQMMYDKWEATSPWFELQVRNANGDMRKIAQEILCSFLGSGDNFVDQEFLMRIELHEIKKPIREENGDNQMHIFEDPNPEDNYIMTLDVSSGHGDDNSTINILKYLEYIEIKNIIKNGVLKKVKLKKFKFEQVAEYIGKLTPQQLGQLAYQYGIKYNYAYCTVDITGGYGSQTVEKLIELGYENMHYADVKHKASREKLDGYVKTTNRQNPDGTYTQVDLIPGFFIGNNRGSVLLELQRCINMSEIIIHSDRTLDELKTFVTVKGSRVADHKRCYHDDSIMGIAIALYVVNYEMHKFKLEKTDAKKLMESLERLNNRIDSDYRKPERMFKSIPSNHPQSQHGWLLKSLNR